MFSVLFLSYSILILLKNIRPKLNKLILFFLIMNYIKLYDVMRDLMFLNDDNIYIIFSNLYLKTYLKKIGIVG